MAAGSLTRDDRKSMPGLTDGSNMSQYRVDPAPRAAANPPPFPEDANSQQTAHRSKALVSATTSEPSASELGQHSKQRTIVGKNSPDVALEVDRLVLPVACRLLLEQADEELESAASVVGEQLNNGSQILAIVSTDEGEGCTTVALCLTHRLAARGTRVCLVDGSFARPRLAGIVGLEPDCGLESVLAGESALSEVLIESIEDRLTLLPLCKPLRAEEIERAKLRHTVTLGALRDQFDVVLIDAGCAGSPTGRINILDGGSIDAAILVGTANRQPMAWDRARRAIEQRSVPCLGAIENRCIS